MAMLEQITRIVLFSNLFRCAAMLSVSTVMFLMPFTNNANATDTREGYKPKESDQRRTNVAVMLQMALKTSRYQLRNSREECDAHAVEEARGNVTDLIALAACFRSGVGRPKSLLRAKTLLEAAAGLGSSEARLELGRFYQDGRVVRRDLERASSIFRAAAIAGLPEAMVEYGLVLLRNRSDRHAVACKWFERAARRGDRDGVRLLGDCFAQAIGGRRDQSIARHLYQRAARFGDRTARLKLDGHVFTGIGGAIAGREGCEWASRAAVRGNQSASKALAYCLSVAR